MTVYNFNLSERENLDLAVKALAKSNTEKAIKYLNRAIEINPANTEANFLLASVYADINSYDFSNETAFRTLPYVKDPLEKERFFVLLAMNFAQLGEFDTASYYVSLISERGFDEFGIEMVEEFDPFGYEEEGFELVYPRTKEYYAKELEKAHQLTRNKMYAESIRILKQFKTGMPLKAQADHLLLVNYMLKEDIDRVISAGSEILKSGEETSLGVKCTLITAYMLGGKDAEAQALLNELLEKEYDSFEDISVLLPILVNFARHEEIIKYSEKFISKYSYHPQTMLWLAQAKYNTGDKKGAIISIRKLKELYRTFEAAEYFLNLFMLGPDSVHYSVDIPILEAMERHRVLKEFTDASKKERKKAIKYDSRITKYIRWAFKTGNVPLGMKLVEKLDEIFCAEAEALLRYGLLCPNLKIPVFCEMIRCLFKRKGSLDISAVLENQYLEINYALPYYGSDFPQVIFDTVAYMITEMVYGSDQYQEELKTLDKLMQKTMVKKGGEIYFGKATLEEVSKLKSAKTIAVALFERIDIFTKEDIRDITERFGVNSTTLKRYRKVLFDD